MHAEACNNGDPFSQGHSIIEICCQGTTNIQYKCVYISVGKIVSTPASLAGSGMNPPQHSAACYMSHANKTAHICGGSAGLHVNHCVAHTLACLLLHTCIAWCCRAKPHFALHMGIVLYTCLQCWPSCTMSVALCSFQTNPTHNLSSAGATSDGKSLPCLSC